MNSSCELACVAGQKGGGGGEKGGGEEVKGALPINTHIVGYSRLCVTGKLRIGLSNHINIHPR